VADELVTGAAPNSVAPAARRPVASGPDFDGVRIGRPAVAGLIDAGFSRIDDLPGDLDELERIHGLGPKAIRLLGEARTERHA
jgi:hypothetical protein